MVRCCVCIRKTDIGETSVQYTILCGFVWIVLFDGNPSPIWVQSLVDREEVGGMWSYVQSFINSFKNVRYDMAINTKN